MNTEQNIQIVKPFLASKKERLVILDFDKSENRFLNSENLNKLQNLNLNNVEKDNDTHETLTNISIENTISSINNNKIIQN